MMRFGRIVAAAAAAAVVHAASGGETTVIDERSALALLLGRLRCLRKQFQMRERGLGQQRKGQQPWAGRAAALSWLGEALHRPGVLLKC